MGERRERHAAAGKSAVPLRGGMTLMEILVAAALALLLIVAMVQIFAAVGSAVSTARATLELSGQLRNTSNRLNEDLQGVTVAVRPWTSPADGGGYFEIIDGPLRDGSRLAADQSVGDTDDAVMMTVRSRGRPFVGRVQGFVVGSPNPFEVIESELAEIVWWTQLVDANENGSWDPGETYTLHRRVLLIRPDLNNADGLLWPITTPPPITTPRDLRVFLNRNDISVRLQYSSSGSVVGIAANSLADLTQRENRFGHWPVDTSGMTPVFSPAGVGFPYAASGNPANPVSIPSLTKWDVEPGPDGAWGVAGTDDDGNGLTDDASEAGWPGSDDIVDNRRGEDVILSNVVAFDVRVFDPDVEVKANNDVPLVPGDPGYSTSSTTVGFGAFVDLNHGAGSGLFSGPPDPRSKLSVATYCTWSPHYESDGVDQDNDGLVDEGTDGIDNDGANGVDDPAERETMPPYPYPLRGVQVTVRVIELDTKQVRQVSVVADFVPE